MADLREEYAAALEALKASRGFGTQSSKEEEWIAVGQSNKFLHSDKELREKALMYAVQTYGQSLDGIEIVTIAEDYLAFLRGDAA